MNTATQNTMTAPTTKGVVYDETGHGVFVPAPRPTPKQRHEAVRAEQKAMTITLPSDFLEMDWK